MSKTVRNLDQLEAEYLERKAKIRAEEGLSWEKRELAIKQLGDEHHRARKERKAA